MDKLSQKTDWERLIPPLIANFSEHPSFRQELEQASVKELIAYAVILASNVYKREEYTAWADSYLHGCGAGKVEEIWSLAADDAAMPHNLPGAHAAMWAAVAVGSEANVWRDCNPVGWAATSILCAAYRIHQNTYF